jgi:hypothetical protein
MSESDQAKQGAAPPPDKVSSPKGKRRYEKPSFKFEKVFETQALSCGKISITLQQCRLNRKNS